MSNSKVLAQTSHESSLQNEIPKTSAWDDFLAIIKIGIIKSNLITTFTGLWLALHFSGMSFLNNLDIVFLSLVGSALIIGGAGTLNNYIDRDIDHLMERTKARPTVTGKVNSIRVLVLGLALVTVGTILLAMTTLSAALIGLLGVFAYVVLYTFSKRYFVSNTIIGCISGATPPLIGWAAVDGNLDVMAWVLYLLMFIWQPPHFYALAMRRCEEYRKAGIPMLPVVKGFKRTKLSINFWVLLLMPLPYFLLPLGTPLVILTIILNVGWLAYGLYGFKMKDDIKWAKGMFIYSLNYLTILFVSMVIVTLI
ncbi:heme o synthase [Bacillus massiliigorillae]|uniref:heme o synthase n=1 Tax=Bacillus massiliigorillae TaxID=1243664 RepID=UPI0003A1F931|nr:heme o synthase [Bacillus massiliigorillae]